MRARFFDFATLACLAVFGVVAVATTGCEDQPAAAPADEGAGTFGAADPSKPWVQLPGKAFDIQSGGTEGSLWSLGAEGANGGGANPGVDHYVYRYQSGNWVNTWGWGMALAVKPDNSAICIVNSYMDIWCHNTSTGQWWNIPGKGLDIAFGANGSLWVVGSDHAVWRHNGGGDWTRVNAYADKIAIEGDNTPWVLNPWGIYRLQDFNAGAWTTIPGAAKDIGIGTDGSVFVVGTDPRLGGYTIWSWNGNGWFMTAQQGTVGGGVKVAVDVYGRALVVNSIGDIFLQGDTPIPVPGGVYSIMSKNSGKCLNVPAYSNENGKGIVQWNCGGGDDMKFKAVHVGGGWFNFVAMHSGKCLDIAGISTALAANLQQWDCWGGDNQKFKLVSQGDGYYGIIAKHSNLGLDVAEVSKDNGKQVWQWVFWGAPNQVWKLSSGTSSGQIVGVSLAGGGASCNYTEVIPGSYDIACGNLMTVKGLKGYINSNTSFSLDAPVGNLKSALPGVAPLVNFVDANILTGLDSANIHVDGPDQGSHVRITAVVGFGAAFLPLLATIDDLFGVNLAALKPFVTIEIQQGQVVVDVQIYNGPRVEKELPEIGTAFALNSLSLRYKSSEGEKVVSVRTNCEIKVTSADNWVPATLDVVRNLTNQTTVASGTFTNWNKPLGFVPVDVKEAFLAAGFNSANKLSAYRIDIGKAYAYAGGNTYTLKGEYAVDRGNKRFAFGLQTPKVPLTLAVQMLAGIDDNLQKVLAALKLDTVFLEAYAGKDAFISFSPTGGEILGKVYEQKSYAYGQVALSGLSSGNVPAVFDATANVQYDANSKKYTVGDFKAKVQLDLVGLTNAIKQSANAVAGILSVFKLKTVSVDIARTNGAVSGGGSATMRVCGQENTVAFDTSNLMGLVNAGISFIGNVVTSCMNWGSCPAGYTKMGLLCDKNCPSGYYNSSAGICKANSTECPNPTVGYIWPNCKTMSPCPAGSHAGTSAFGAAICIYSCADVGLSGAPADCINADQGKSMIYPE